jgi:hypothetical protein
MGARYLLELADVCRRTGYPVIEVDGWQYRARGSGGYEPGRPTHVLAHHTASPPSSDGWPDANYCTFGDEDAPLCNLYLGRDGTIWVCAGGATNTNGSGTDLCGITPDDSMNSHAIGIEAGNNGVGEAWPDAQQDAYVTLVAELCAAYGIDPAQVHSHQQWAPSRKVDPAGPSDWASGTATWDMPAFCDDVRAVAAPPIPGPNPTPTPPDEDDDMPRYIYGLTDYANTFSQEGIQLSPEAFDVQMGAGAILIRSEFHGQHIKSLLAASGLTEDDLDPL